MYKMLLVDDRKIFLRTVRRMPFFRDHEEEIRIEWETCRADSALEILRKEHVDIVMTDIRMPMMSGIDLLKAIRRENLCSCTILMSEYTDFAYLTARAGIVRDTVAFFQNMMIGKLDGSYRYLLVSPVSMKQTLIELIDREIAKGENGLYGYIDLHGAWMIEPRFAAAAAEW